MSNRRIKPQYRCESCGDLHDSEYWAEQCCPPEISVIYLCDECEEEHDTEEEALRCCQSTDADDGQPPRPHPRDLEAHGQQRLF